LGAVVKLADEEFDASGTSSAETACCGSRTHGAHKVKPTIEEGQAAICGALVKTWWDKDRGMLHVRGEPARRDGRQVRGTIKKLTETIAPRRDSPGNGGNAAPPTRSE